jgi:hypothetical protein
MSASFEETPRGHREVPAHPFVSDDPLSPQRSFRNQLVRVTRLAVASLPIQGYRFENCEIVGPAIFSEFSRVTLSSCTFESTVSFVDLPADASGTLRLRRCVFVHCAFADVGFALGVDATDALLGRVARRA